MKFYLEYFFLTFIILTLFHNPVFSSQMSTVSENKVQERIKSVEKMKDINEKEKTHLLDVYSKILDNLDSIKTNNKQSDFFSNIRTQEPEETKQLQAKLEKLESEEEKRKLVHEVEKSSEHILANIKIIPLEELEQTLNSEAANLVAVTAKKSDLKQSLNQEKNSSSGIRKRILEVNRELEQRQEEKNLTPPAGSNAKSNEAELWLLNSHIESLRSEIKMLDLKLLSQPSRLKILNLKSQLSEFSLKKMRVKVKQLKHQVDLKRSSEIQKTQEMTQTEQSEAQGKHALIQSLAQNNTLLSEVVTQRTRELIKLESSDDIIFKETQRIKEQQASTRKKLEIAGLNQIIGQVLWEQKKALPDSRQYINNLEKREHLISKLGLEHLQYQEELVKINDRNSFLSQLFVNVTPEAQAAIKDDLFKLIKTRKTLLKKIILIDEQYIKAMSELDFAEKKLIDVADSYALLLDEQLFWLRSATVLSWNNFEKLPKQIQFILHPSKWLKFIHDFFTVSQSSYQIIPGLLFILLILFKRARIKELLTNTGVQTKKISTDKLLYTWKAIFYTFLLSVPASMLLWMSGWQLVNTPNVSPFSHAIANGMLILVLPLFSLTIFRYMCLPGGLFEIHFKWSDELIKGLRDEMGRLMLTFLPILFITALLIYQSEGNMNDGLGRLFLILTLMTFFLFFYRMLKPKNGFLTSVAKRKPDSFFAKYQMLLFISGLLIVVALMVLTVVGYVYTAAGMTERLIYSVWFVFALVILQQTSIRWLLLTRRRHALKMAYEKRQEAQALNQEQNNHSSASTTDNDQVIDFEEPEIDIVSLSEESQKLLNLSLFILAVSGFIFLWSDVFPALGIFEKITLWHYEGVVEGSKLMLPVTLGDLTLSLLVLILTFVGAKRFPAIIEILLIQNSNVSSGDRYTVTTLISYTIVGVGLFIMFNLLGAEWDRFQWMFAALSVGIGFGLQEIVANFISGLIILFERPIRVGDHISVGQDEGIVTRIQIRATTILTYDRKELLVPNKEFITGQLVNLSLSDPIARLVIPIGVAYGSDVSKARELLLEAADEHERVLEEPVSRVIFHSFGDNSLNLQLRCFVGNVDYRMSTISEINEAVNKKFIAAGISIAFPQRDVHLDIKQPIDVCVQNNSK